MRTAVRGNRLVCSALLIGQILMATIVGMVQILDMKDAAVDSELATVFHWVGPAVGLAAIPIAYAARHLIWRRGADGSTTVLLQSFFAGNLAFQALLEGAGLLNLTLWLVTAEAMPYLPVAIVLILFGVVGLLRSPPLDS